MNLARKDSKLKKLPAPVQAELFEICKKENTGYDEARAWLKEQHGIVVKSNGTVSKWFRWYPFSLKAASARAQDFHEEIAQLESMRGNAAALSEVAQIGFEMLAMQQQDLEGFATLKKLRLEESKGKRDERRIALLEKKAAQADQAEAITGNQGLSDEEKAAQMRALFGMG